MSAAAVIIFLFAAPIVGIAGIMIHVRMARFRWLLNLVVLPAMVLTGPFFFWLLLVLPNGGGDDALGLALMLLFYPYLGILAVSLLLYAGIAVSQLWSEYRVSHATPHSS